MRLTGRMGLGGLAALTLAAGAALAASAAPAGLEAFLSYPFQDDLTAAPHGGAIAWVGSVNGVRNVWTAQGPAWVPRQITTNKADDGQEITGLTFSPDGARLIWVRGGDHDANWPAEGGLAPDPAADTEQPQVTLWTADLAGGGAPVKLTEGDEPAMSSRGVLAFIRDHQVWTIAADGKGKAERLFFDRGRDGELAWSPDGARLAFVSRRGDHAFVGVYSARERPLTYLAPSTGFDDAPVWSPDGARIAFTRQPGAGGVPEPLLEERPQPWSIWVADAAGGPARAVWRSGKAIADSYPEVAGSANLAWAGADRLVFLSEADHWQHLYAVPAAGGAARLLTPGDYMVEHVTVSPDGHAVIFDANAGPKADDAERRHVFAVDPAGGAPRPLTPGSSLEWAPVSADAGHAAFISAGARTPPRVAVVGLDGAGRRDLAGGEAAGYPVADMVEPRTVAFKAADGLTVHGVLFEQPGAAKARPRPAVVFVHGGPPRQMLLGWHYMDYYTHAYAVNQYLAAHGYVVLSVNYRLGIGYGRDFNHPAQAGFRGGAEYQDVLAGGKFLQALPEVDPGRIGIWGGSYGGYLTAMALSHNSDVFKVGVDLHGVHDWSATLGREMPPPPAGFEKGDREAALATAFKASPVADLSHWTSPVLLIQGDDDRNVSFHETIDLARRLDALGVAYDELVLPNEIHGFLRHASWLSADTATVEFLGRALGEQPGK